MRTLAVLLALILVAGCRVTPTAPTSIQPDAVSWQAPPHASAWIHREYRHTDRFPELADLTYRIVGDKLVLEARFTGAPVPIGEDWRGAVGIRNGGLAFNAEDATQRLSIQFGSRNLPVSVVHNGRHPATARIIGPILRATCDASLFDFEPTVIFFNAVAWPYNPSPDGRWFAEVSTYEKALTPSIAVVDR
jgi:hypothetical protein